MGKYDVLAEIANKLRALDNEVKLKILALLIEEGSKSITDISKELDINFSTAHKYLEQLEAAGLVTSKQVSENRLKRLFYVRDFDIELSPKGLSELISGKKKESTKGKFKVLNEKGELVDFDEKLFAQKYLKRGMPRGTIVNALNTILEQAYNDVTLLELRQLFKKELEKKVENINDVFEQIEEADKHKRTYAHLMDLVHPEALDKHANGDIFIRNLRDPKLFNFVHDLKGTITHGIQGKRPKTLHDLFAQTLIAIKAISEYVYPTQAFQSFNYQIAPLAANLSESELSKELKDFLTALETTKTKFYINLEVGEPRFVKLMTSGLNESDLYFSYNKAAEKILHTVIDTIRKNNFTYVRPVLKIWTSKFDDRLMSGFKELYVANMKPAWQTVNASYVGTHRFDTSWKRIRDSKVGTIQTITINLPKIAARTKSEKEFFAELKKLVDDSAEYIFNMLELTLGEFLRKHKTTFESEQRGRWDYVHVNDSAYHIAITGINDAVKILSGSSLDKNLKLAEKILKFCNDALSEKKDIPLRLELKEARIKDVTDRFSALDSKTSGKNLSYSVGLDCDDFKASAKLHKFFIGGHCVEINKNQVQEFLKTDGGLAFVKG